MVTRAVPRALQRVPRWAQGLAGCVEGENPPGGGLRHFGTPPPTPKKYWLTPPASQTVNTSQTARRSKTTKASLLAVFCTAFVWQIAYLLNFTYK